MPSVTKEVEVSSSPEDALAIASDPGRFEEWLALHDSWPDGAPASTDAGDQFTQRLKVMGMGALVEWTVAERGGNKLVLAGVGPMGAEMTSTIEVAPSAAGAIVSYTAAFDGGPAAGPMGSMMTKKAGEALETSMTKLKDLIA